MTRGQLRPGRTLSILLALALLVAAPLVATQAAQASTKPHHTVVAKGVEPKTNVFILKGYVKPTYSNAPIVIEKKNCGGCSWYGWKHTKTDGTSHFRTRVYGPVRGSSKDCFRVKVPETKKYAVSRSNVLCIVRQ